MGANAPRKRIDRRLPLRSEGQAPKPITGHFAAPSFGEILAWAGYSRTFADSPLTLLVFQYVCNALEGRRRVDMPARQVAAELRCSIRTTRKAIQALRSAGLILTTITTYKDPETGRDTGADYWLRFMPGPELCRLTGYDPRKRAGTPAPPVNAPATVGNPVIHNNLTTKPDPRFSHVYRGAMDSSPNPIRDNNKQHRSTPPLVDNLRKRGDPAGSGGVVLIGPKGRLVERLNGALGERGRTVGAIDQRACHAVARIAVDFNLANEAEAIARYAGRATWAKVPGAVMVQRFVDLLDRLGLDEAIPIQWQHKRRSESERVKHRIDEGPQ